MKMSQRYVNSEERDAEDDRAYSKLPPFLRSLLLPNTKTRADSGIVLALESIEIAAADLAEMVKENALAVKRGPYVLSNCRPKLISSGSNAKNIKFNFMVCLQDV
jgi:hypothetical protein